MPADADDFSQLRLASLVIVVRFIASKGGNVCSSLVKKWPEVAQICRTEQAVKEIINGTLVLNEAQLGMFMIGVY